MLTKYASNLRIDIISTKYALLEVSVSYFDEMHMSYIGMDVITVAR